MTITDTTPVAPPDLRRMTDDQIAALYYTDDQDTSAAALREMDRRDRAAKMAKAQRALGGIREAGDSAAFAQYLDADAHCRGELLSREGKAAFDRGEISDEQALWRMPWHRAERYCSEELIEYFKFTAPRITAADYVRQQAAQRRTAQAEARDEKGENREELDRHEPRALRRETPAEDTQSAGGTDGPVRGGGRGSGEGEDGGEDGTGAGGPGGPVHGGPVNPGDEPAQCGSSGITGAAVLNDARNYAASVLYATDEMLDALTLLCAVTHTVESFSTVPRALATSPEKESGKSTLLDIAIMLSNNGWEADPTSYALRAKFNEPERPTLVIDEISDIFGQSGLRGQSNPVGKILRKGYRQTATLSMAVDRVATDVSCYCVALMAGLKTAVPPDIRSRCIVWNMKPLPESWPRLRDSQDEDTIALGKVHSARLHQWARGSETEIRHAFRNYRRPHRRFRARRAQIWGPLYAIALQAGEDWPERCLAAFKAMALDASDVPVLSPGQMILRDAAACFAKSKADRLFAADIARHLRSIPDVELYEDLTDRGLAQLMTEALGPSQSMTIGDGRARGYHARPVLAAWERTEAQLDPIEDDEEDDDEYDSMFEVTLVTDITELAAQEAPSDEE